MLQRGAGFDGLTVAHEDADHVMTRLLQKMRGHAAIDAARHRQHDTRHGSISR